MRNWKSLNRSSISRGNGPLWTGLPIVRSGFLIGFSSLVLCGCGGGQQLFPLEEGKRWTYSSYNGFATFIETARVEKQLSVAGVRGWEISGPLGSSRLAWQGDTLVAERFVNARFVPPLAILVAGDPQATKKWKGRVETPAGYFEAEAELTQSTEKLKIALGRFEAVKTKLALFWPGNRTEVVSWYAENVGLLRQEQRTNDSLDSRLDLLSTDR